jgi:hypothetical protein
MKKNISGYKEELHPGDNIHCPDFMSKAFYSSIGEGMFSA